MGAAIGAIRSWLAHPLTRGLDLDDPRTTDLRRDIVREKLFLRRIYEEWYAAMAAAIPGGDAPVLELGSGGGFLNEFIPGLITSEVFPCPGVDRVIDAHELPFEDGALRGIAMTNVLHHLPRVRRFLSEARRCVRSGGVLVMLEPWMTVWSRIVYSRLHHEPFDVSAPTWEFVANGPLSGANGALPWIIFHRDRAQFEAEFPGWKIMCVRPMMPLRYLLSGGVSMRSLMPGWTSALWRGLEQLLSPWTDRLAMFALIVLVRAEPVPEASVAAIHGRKGTGALATAVPRR